MNKQVSLLDHEADAPAVIQADENSLLAVISRAAADPKTDVDKLERLLGMAERIEARHAKAAYFAALAEMQDELPIIAERGEIKIGGDNKPGQKYALWEDINKAIKPIMKAHGFAISFRTGLVENKITVTGVLSHRGGHSEETTIHLPSDTSGSKNAVQAVGSSTSYGKRYVTAALLNLTSGDERDDDGHTAGGNGPISEDQVQKIRDLIAKTKADPEAFCKYFKIEAVPDLRAKDFDRAVAALNLKDRRVREGQPT
jgi:hypothetical protein